MKRAWLALAVAACTARPVPVQGVPGWTWVPVLGSVCGSGSSAGFAYSAGTTDELFIFLQGGGACWNSGTCVPSHAGFGPICSYATDSCLADTAGGTRPLSSHVIEPDPFPVNGGGALPAELQSLTRMRPFDRAADGNPFATATYVYVPYCTGDLHSGSTTHDFPQQVNATDQPSTFTMHFTGASNMTAYLEQLTEQFPAVQRIWLTGTSAGGYGATFNFDRVARAFPEAEVQLLADSAPFIETAHFAEWRDTWSMQFPTGCDACADGGLPAVVEHLSTAYPGSRFGLLSSDRDKIIAYFFYAGEGPNDFVNPPVATFDAALQALEARYGAHANTKYFVVPGDAHGLWGAYGSRLDDGTYTQPHPSADGSTNERVWVDAWADGGAAWQSTR